CQSIGNPLGGECRTIDQEYCLCHQTCSQLGRECGQHPTIPSVSCGTCSGGRVCNETFGRCQCPAGTIECGSECCAAACNCPPAGAQCGFSVGDPPGCQPRFCDCPNPPAHCRDGQCVLPPCDCGGRSCGTVSGPFCTTVQCGALGGECPSGMT